MADQLLTLSDNPTSSSSRQPELGPTNLNRTPIHGSTSEISRAELDETRRRNTQNDPALMALGAILTTSEIATLSTTLANVKRNGIKLEVSQHDNSAVSAILDSIAKDSLRLEKLGITDNSPQVIASSLAKIAFTQKGSAPLVQLLTHSAALEHSTTPASLSTPRTDSSAAERADIIQRVRNAALHQANTDFSKSPTARMDPRTARITLHGILNNHPDFQHDAAFQKVMADTYTANYQEKNQDRFESMNFIQRGYYSFTRQWSENLSQIGTFFTKVAEKSVEAAKNIAHAIDKGVDNTIEAAKNLGAGVASVASKVYAVATDSKTYSSIGNALLSGFEAITTLENYQKIGSAIVSGVSATISAIQNIDWSAVGSSVWNGVKSVGNFAYECCTDPAKLWQVTKAVGSFAYGLADSLGIIDIGYGVYKFGEGLVRSTVGQVQFALSALSNTAQLLTGQQSFDQFTNNISKSLNSSFGKALECFYESGSAVKGAVVAIGEVTGLSDAVRCVNSLIKGDYVNAAISGGIAAATIGAFIWSGGLSSIGVAAGKLGVTQVTKVALTKTAAEGLEALGKTTAKEVMSGIVKELGESSIKAAGTELSEAAVRLAGEKALTQAVERSTSRILTEGITQLAANVQKDGIKALVGAEARQTVKDLFEKSAYQATKDLLAELKVYDHVKSATFDLLKTIDNKSIAGLEKRLISAGVSDDTAKLAAKSLRKSLHRGFHDEEMIEILTKNISDEISSQISKRMETTFKAQFATALEGKLPKGASGELNEAVGKLHKAMDEKSIKLTKEQIDELVEAGWEGCVRGVRRATDEVVGRAVRDAFDEFRKFRRGLRPSLAFSGAVGENAFEELHSNSETTNSDQNHSHSDHTINEVDRHGKLDRKRTRFNTLLDKATEVIDDGSDIT